VHFLSGLGYYSSSCSSTPFRITFNKTYYILYRS